MDFFVDVAKHLESNNVLVAVHQSLVALGPLLEATVAPRGHVAEKNTSFTVCFHLVEGLLEPFELIAGVISELHQEEVGIVAGFGIYSDDSDFVHDRTIAQFQFLRVEAVDSELFLSGFVQPDFPQFEIVCDHGISLGEILGVDGHTEVVVAFQGISRPG